MISGYNRSKSYTDDYMNIFFLFYIIIYLSSILFSLPFLFILSTLSCVVFMKSNSTTENTTSSIPCKLKCIQDDAKSEALSLHTERDTIPHHNGTYLNLHSNCDHSISKCEVRGDAFIERTPIFDPTVASPTLLNDFRLDHHDTPQRLDVDNKITQKQTLKDPKDITKPAKVTKPISSFSTSASVKLDIPNNNDLLQPIQPLSPPLVNLRKQSQKSQPPQKLENICVLGAGSFGTAIGAMFARNGHKVTLLDRNEERTKVINTTHRNPSYLSDVDLPPTLSATVDPKIAFDNCTMVFHAIPVQSSECYLRQFVGLFPQSIPIVCMSKGIHCQTLQFMSDIITNVFGVEQKSACLSGPSFAKEIIRQQPTGLVIASACPETALQVANTIANDPKVRAWTTDDVIGVEVGGALKNVYAIGAGIVQGAGYGYNTTALMVTRGCLEMAKLAKALGAKEKTLSGMSGIGDLMLTCFGPASRNRTVGERIGKGETLEQVLESMSEVAEGVPTIKSAVRLAKKLGLLDQLPLLQCIHDVVFGAMDKDDLAEYIMTFPVSDEMA